MTDVRSRWMDILNQTTDESVDSYIDSRVNMLDEALSVRNSFARTGTGGDPLVSRGAGAYGDIDDDEKTVGKSRTVECDDPIAEALQKSFPRRRLNEAESDAKKKLSTIRNIRSSLEQVWSMLGNAETKLGIAQFNADDMDFSGVEKTLIILVKNIREVMARLETARDSVKVEPAVKSSKKPTRPKNIEMDRKQDVDQGE